MIPSDQIKDLADLYDRFVNALDPFSEDRDQAEQSFYLKLDQLHSIHCPSVNNKDFQTEAVRQCRKFLIKNH